MKKSFIFILSLFIASPIFAITVQQGTASVVSPFPIYYKTPGTANAAIAFTTADVTSLSCSLNINGTTTAITMTKKGIGTNDCWPVHNPSQGIFQLELTAAQLATLGSGSVSISGTSILVSSIPIDVVAPGFWTGRQDQVSTAARIASATADIAVVGANVLSASDTLAQRIIANGYKIAAGGTIIPTTGGIIGRPAAMRTGDPANWYLSIPVLSRSGADPGLKITIIEGDLSYSLYKTQADFTRIAVSVAQGIGDVTPVLHNYLLNTSGMPYKQFPVECHIENNGELVGLAGVFVNDTTPEFVDSPENIATMDYIKSTMRDLASGIPAEVTRYQAIGTIHRASPEISTEINRYIPSGKPALTISTYVDSDGVQWNVLGYYDYSESNDTIRRKWYSTIYSTLADLVAAWGISSASIETW